MNILVEATENKLNVQQLKVLELDTVHHLALPALFILAEACSLLMELRKQGKAAAKMSTVAEKILTKANYVKATRHHKNCFPFVQDWLERFMVRDASRQENDLGKIVLHLLIGIQLGKKDNILGSIPNQLGSIWFHPKAMPSQTPTNHPYGFF